jgi:chemotaxis protein methyltransferase CheR
MALTEPDIDFLSGLVAKYSGNVIAQRQAYMLEKQLTPIAQSIGLENTVELVRELQRNENQLLSTKIAEAVTVNETSFFRDGHPFEALKNKVIPDLVAKNQSRKELKIWCAASSCGQEPYTIAMVIKESFPHLSSWNIKITGTDISEEMLAKCKSGEYSQLEVNRGLPVKKLVRFFERQGSTWRAKQELRDMIDFRRLNLTSPFPNLGQFDIVFIRNVLIYFDEKTKIDILNRVRRVLRPDGYLFIGSVETTIGLGVAYQREEIDASVCYRPTN